MTDDAPAFYNAWVSVMGSVEHRLLCTWHVDRNWRQNLCKISGEPEKKALVYKTLGILLQTTSVEQFSSYLQNVIRDLKDDDTNRFGMYFEKYYSRRPEVWTYFFRLRLGINTNMYLESFHKILKLIYLEGKRVKRLDKTIHALMKFSRDSLYKRLIKLSKYVPTEKVQKVCLSHNISETIKLEQIKILENEKGYIIHSLSNPSQQYNIIKVGETCTHPACLKCKKCKICIHTYHCSCIDNVIKANICNHIHTCAHNFYKHLDCNNIFHNETNLEEQKILIDMNTTYTNHHKNDQNLKIKNQAEIILGLSGTNSLSDINRIQIEKKLSEVITVMNEGEKIKLTPVDDINITKTIDRQIRLYSTKKKSSHKTQISKPSINETNH